MSKAPIRVLIADDHPVVRERLRSVLGERSDLQIVGEAVDGAETIEKVIQLDPDIVLLDPDILLENLKVRPVDKLAVLRSIKTCAPKSKVILFASPGSKKDFVEAIRLGCSGILLKEVPTSFFAKSIRRAHAGEIWVDSITRAAMIHHFASGHGSRSSTIDPDLNVQLSRRERELILLIAHGLRNKEIAERMLITVQTVKNHLRRVFNKLGVSDRLELALYAVHKLMDP
ncbi:MAG: response regulator transcription factor [Bryobacteraceae bacterium]